jgi:aminocarboxymuconate-semialdehyde decarboxylase
VLTVDIHTHIIPRDLPDLCARYGYEGFIALNHHKPCCAQMLKGGTVFREVDHNCWDPDIRASECQRDGVSVQVLSTIPVMFSYWARPDDAHDLSRYLNDHIAGICREHPSHFVGLATLPMQSPALAITELERCVNELGLAGIQIGSHIDRPGELDWNLNDKRVVEVLEACQELDAAVFVHPWDMPSKQHMERYWLPWLVGMPAESSRAICSIIFGGVLTRLPNLRIAFAHGGGAFPGTIGRIEHGHSCRPDLVAIDNPNPPRDSLGSFWVDSLVHDQTALRHIVELFGESKVALGSDYPFPLGEQQPGSLIDSMAEFSIELKAKLRGRNALEFLGTRAANHILSHHTVTT